MKGRERNEKFFDAAKQTNKSVAAGSMKGVLKTARMTGVVNLSNRSLVEFPREVCFYEEGLEADEKYWEICPLTKLDMSYNKVEFISPDIGRLSELSILKLRDNCLKSPVAKELFRGCPLLRHLDLCTNQITRLEEDISNLFELRELFLGENLLESLPNSMRGCANLQILELQNNKLRSLPKDFYFPHLTKLCISGNNLEELPRGIEAMTALQSLEVKKNNLLRLPSLSKLVKLVFLDASENRIVAMPDLPIPTGGAGGKPVLDRLYLSFNKLSSWDTKVLERQASSLTELIVANNLFESIDPTLAIIRNLQVLDVSNNSINDLPATIGYLNSLQRLGVDGNPIRSIRRSLLSSSTNDLKTFLRTRGPPLAVATSTGQQVVIDDYSPTAPGYVMMIPSHLITPKGNELTDRIREVGSNGQLDLSSMGLVAWTPEFTLRLDQSHLVDKCNADDISNNSAAFSAAGSLFRSERPVNQNSFFAQGGNGGGGDGDGANRPVRRVFALNLCKNAFKDVPDELITRLVCLQTLNLSGNMLSELLASGGNRSAVSRFPATLTSLDISDNRLVNDQFSGIFHISMRTSLQELNMSGNYVSELPNSFHQYFESLRVLKCSNCRLITIENIQFDKIPNLETIDFSSNQLSSMQSLVSCNRMKLQSISVDNNNIKDVPSELGFFEKLRHFGLYGNPQKAIVTSKLSNTNAILLSLRNRSSLSSSSSSSAVHNSTSSASLSGNHAFNSASPSTSHNNISSNNNSNNNMHKYGPSTSNSKNYCSGGTGGGSGVGGGEYNIGQMGTISGKSIQASDNVIINSNNNIINNPNPTRLSEISRKFAGRQSINSAYDADDRDICDDASSTISSVTNASIEHRSGIGNLGFGRGGYESHVSNSNTSAGSATFDIAKFKEGFAAISSSNNLNMNIVGGGRGGGGGSGGVFGNFGNLTATNMHGSLVSHHPGIPSSSSGSHSNANNATMDLKKLQFELQTLENELETNISISNSRKVQVNRSIAQARASIARLKAGGGSM